jgi:23S rRNA pseudouridine2605 synthase
MIYKKKGDPDPELKEVVEGDYTEEYKDEQVD